MRHLDDLSQILRQHTWDKELDLWIGPESPLRTVLDGLRVETIDLLDLFDAGKAPLDDDDVREYVVRTLRERLKTIQRLPGKRTALLVHSAGLLARYHVGVREFYDWFCDDFSIVFLLIAGVCFENRWPEDVECRPDQLIDYFKDLVKHQFSA